MLKFHHIYAGFSAHILSNADNSAHMLKIQQHQYHKLKNCPVKGNTREAVEGNAREAVEGNARDTYSCLAKKYKIGKCCQHFIGHLDSCLKKKNLESNERLNLDCGSQTEPAPFIKV